MHGECEVQLLRGTEHVKMVPVYLRHIDRLATVFRVSSARQPATSPFLAAPSPYPPSRLWFVGLHCEVHQRVLTVAVPWFPLPPSLPGVAVGCGVGRSIR